MVRASLVACLALVAACSQSAVVAVPPPRADEHAFRPFDVAASPGAAELEVGAAAARGGDWAAARAALSGASDRVAARDRLDVTLARHALLARACERLRDFDCSDREAKAALGAWGDQASAAARLAAVDTEPDAANERRQRALEAVGEAIFLLGEHARAEAERVPMPTMHVAADRDATLAFLKTELGPWVARRRAKVDAAAKVYERILDTDKAPPPDWHIACAAAAGEMKSRLVDVVRGAPIPDAWKRDGEVPGGGGLTYQELRREYAGMLAEAIAPLETSARHAFGVCQKVAVKWGIDDATSRRCVGWLEAHPADVRALDRHAERAPVTRPPPSGLPPAHFRDATRIVEVVQPSPGATLEIGAGTERAVLRIPEYALSAPTEVTFEIVPSRARSRRLGKTYAISLGDGHVGCPSCEIDLDLGHGRTTANLANEVILEGGVPMVLVIAPLRVDAEKKTASFEVALGKRWTVYLTDEPPAKRESASDAR